MESSPKLNTYPRVHVYLGHGNSLHENSFYLVKLEDLESVQVNKLEKESRNEVKFVRYKRNLICRIQDACALKKRSMNYFILHLSSYVFLKFHETTVCGRVLNRSISNRIGIGDTAMY